MNTALPDEPELGDGPRSWWIGHAVAVLALATATLVRLALDPVLGNNYPFVTYVGAVTLVAWFGRTPPAVFTLVLGGVLTYSLFAPKDPSAWLGMGLYSLVGAAIVAMSHAMRQARSRAEHLLAQALVREAELRQSVMAEAEQREGLRTTLASIGDAVITTDTAGRVSHLNPVAESLTGWTNAEAAGVPLTQVFQIVNEDTRLPVEHPALRAMTEGVVVGLANHTVLIGKDGTERPIDDSAAPIRGKHGEIVGCVLVFRDITDRKQLEAARREAQAQIAATLESVTDGFIRYDRDWRMVYVNAEAERINRLERAEMLGHTVWELFPAVVGTTLETELRRAMAERVTVEFENRYEPWGRWYALKAYPTPDGGLTTFIRDITEQKAQREALVASEARLRELADAMPQIVYATDADGRVDFTNRQWREYTGQSDAQNADLGPVVHPDDLDAMVRQWETAKATGTTFQAEFRLRRADDGEHRWFLTRAVPVRDAAGQVVKWFGTSTDIHDHKQTERRLVESEARYRAIGESIDFGVWVCDAAGRNTYASESFLRMVGITQQQCSDFGWGDMLHPDDAAETICAWKECVRTQGTWDREHRFRGVDGQWYHVLARGGPLRDAAGEVLGWAGINLDVTRLVQTERDVARLAAESERQRRLYETVLTNTPDFVYVFSLDHKVLYANDALIEMWGRGQDGAIGKTFLEIGYEPWHAEMHDREIDQVRATRQPIRGEVPFNGTNGRRQYDYIFVPVIGADGEVEAVAGTTRDVTDRLQAEERLRASEARQSFRVTLADTIRPLSDPVAVQAEASRVLGERLGANRVVYFEVRGDDYVVEQDYTDAVPSIVGRYPIASFGPEQLALYRAGRTASETDVDAHPSREPGEKAAFAAIQIRSYVGVPLVKDGVFVAGLSVHTANVRTWTPTEIAIIEDTAERTWSAVERVKAEAALRASEESRRLALDTAELGAFNIYPTTNTLESDERFRIIFAGTTEAMGYEQAFTAIHPDDRGRIRAAMAAATRSDDPAPYAEEYRVVHPDGSLRWVFAKGRPSYDREGRGRLVSFDGTVADITARKLVEAERERLVSQLKDQDRRKDEFLATLAHELRNPLAPISNGLQVIRMAGAQGTVEQARSMMERQLVQMIRLVDDLLDVSRVTTGKLELRRERLELRSVIAAALETSRPVIEQQGHDVAVVVPDEPVFVDGDPIRLAQVVSNLLTNSAKYTHRGGHIRVNVARDGATAVVAVADDGIGIPTDMLETVFGMFTQVDRTLEKTTGGLGIGLSLVKGLVEMHGGTIEARSEGEGKGSEFAVRLPVAADVVSDSAAGDAEANGVEPTGPRRILIVDDNADSADSLGQLLEMLGNEVRTAYDGEAGIEAARAFRPCIVLCDIGMPKVNGYDTARRIRAEAWGKDTLLVALTGWSQEEDLQKSADAGFDHHLVKPVDPAALMKLLAAT